MIPMGYEYKVENNVRSFDLNYILDKRGKEGWLLCTLNIIKKDTPAWTSVPTYMLVFARIKIN